MKVIKDILDKLPKSEGYEKKISTKGFLFFVGGMILAIILLVVILSLI